MNIYAHRFFEILQTAYNRPFCYGVAVLFYCHTNLCMYFSYDTHDTLLGTIKSLFLMSTYDRETLRFWGTRCDTFSI